MAKVISYEYELNGVRKVITDQGQLKTAIKETNTELAKTKFGTEEYKQLDKQVAGLKNTQKEVRDQNKLLQKQMVASGKDGVKSYRSLKAELQLLEKQFEDLGVEAAKSKKGLDLGNQIKAIKNELKDLDEIRGRRGLSGAFSDALGDLAGFDITRIASIGGAISLGAEAAANAAQFVGELIPRYQQLNNQIQIFTDESGAALDGLVTQTAAIATTFGQSDQEVANAANSVATQLQIPFEEALDRIEEGFIAGSDLNGEFIQSLQEYPTFFREAGLSADEFFKIANRQATEGIYSDKGLDAVKEATIRLRELPKATLAALDGIGISADEIQATIDDEGIGGAIAKVSERLNQIEDDSPAIGAAIADIFGGPGEDAGLEFLKSLQDINDETTGLLDSTNQFQQQQLRTLEVNKEAAEVQNQLAQALGGTSATIGNLGTQIQTGLLRVLLFLIERFQALWSITGPLREAIGGVGVALGLVTEEGERTERANTLLNGVLKTQEFIWGLVSGAIKLAVDGFSALVGGITSALEWLGILDEDSRKAADNLKASAEATEDLGKKQEEAAPKTEKATGAIRKSTKALEDYKKKANEAAEATDQFADGSLAKLRKELSDLQQDLIESGPGASEGILVKILGAEAALKEAEDFADQLRLNVIGQQRGNLTPLETLTGTPLEGRDFGEELGKAIGEGVTDGVKKEMDPDELFNLVGEVFGAIQNATDRIGEASRARYENELQLVEDRYAAEIDAAEGNAQEQARLRNEQAAAEEAIRQQQFEAEKRFQVASALTNLASGVINILSAPSTIPDPFGALYKVGRIAFLTGTTAAQIAAIKGQTAAEGILVNNTLRGETHQGSNKGIAMRIHGQTIIAEHGENVQQDENGGISIINKRSSAAFGPQLKAAAGKVWAGKSKWLSNINNHRNWGIPYAAEGARLTPDVASTVGPAGSTLVVQTSLSEDSANMIAEKVATGTRQGTKEGFMEGANEANRLSERQARLTRRTGI